MRNEDILMKTDANYYESSGLTKVFWRITRIMSIDQKYIELIKHSKQKIYCLMHKNKTNWFSHIKQAY